MVIENILILAFIAAIFNTDLTGFGQFMICRPIFAAPIFGFLTGDVVSGLWVGVVCELLWVNAVPMGAYLPPDLCSISILTVIWANKYFMGASSSVSCAALLLAIPFGYLCRTIDIYGRKLNLKIMYWVEAGIEKENYGRINKGIAIGLILFVLKFFIFYIFAIIVGGKIFFKLYSLLPDFVLNGLTNAWFVLPLVGFGATVYSFLEIRMKHTKR
jgi:mannose/fructose/N-acetylgalactosamine-specific phosphotransferase system component IIC